MNNNIIFVTKFHCVGRTGFELLILLPHLQRAGILSMYHHTGLCEYYL
jgi:hypothetical protein